jgi:hypothetical protein
MRILGAFFSVIVVYFLSGCGGGGSSTPTASVDSFPLKQAYTGYVQNSGSQNVTISGTYAGVAVSGTGRVTRGNVTSAAFEGKSALSKSITFSGSIAVNGQSVPISTTSTTYVDANYNPLGVSGDEYYVAKSSSIPQTAKINDTANIISYARYSTQQKSSILGETLVSYVMEPDTASTAILKIISTDRNNSGTTLSTSTVTLRVTTSGQITFVSETLAQTNVSLTLTYQ